MSPTLEGWDPLTKHFQMQADDFDRILEADREKKLEVCKHFNSKRGCYRGNSCRYLHIPIGPDSVFKSLEMGSGNLNLELKVPPPNTWVAIEVITIVTPCLFYVHFPIGTTSIFKQLTEAEAGKVELRAHGFN